MKILIGLLFIFTVAKAQLSNGEKGVRMNDVDQITDAVMITNISVDGHPIECRLFIKPPGVIQPVTPFHAAGDWLSHTTISLINRTDKSIVFAEVELVFRDTGDCRSLPCVSTSLRLGDRPAIDSYDGRTGKPIKPEGPPRPPLQWKPGQTISFHVGDYIDLIAHDLSAFMTPANISRVDIHRGVFYFEDGMQWSLGRYAVPDPEHPGKFKELPANYFPGKRGHNWPPGYNN